MISFCFDDFPKSAADEGATLLAEEGARGSFYPCSKHAGESYDGVQQYDVDDLAKLSEAGHEIGCHTAGHARLPDLSAAETDREIKCNAAFLASLGVPPPKTFAYPFGDVTVAVKRRVLPHFAACRGAWAGLNHRSIDVGLLKTVCLEAHVLAKQSAEAWIEEACTKLGWVIFLTHDVAAKPTPFGVTPKFLRQVVQMAIASGAVIRPVGDVIQSLKTRPSGDLCAT